MTRFVRSVQKKQADMTFDGCILLGSGLFGNSSGWHVVYRRSLARTSSVSRLSKLRDGQYATAMVLPGSRNGCS